MRNHKAALCAALSISMLVVAALSSTAAIADTVLPPTASPVSSISTGPSSPVAVMLPSTAPSILRSGAEVPLTLREELTTKKKKLRVGYRFQMEVSADIRQNGVIIIPAGTPVVGEVTEIRNKGMWGKSGYIGARVLSARLGERQIRLTGTFDDKGVTGTGGVVAAVAFIPIAGFITTGTSATIPDGAPVKAFLDEDVAYQIGPVAQQVLTVPASIATGASKP